MSESVIIFTTSYERVKESASCSFNVWNILRYKWVREEPVFVFALYVLQDDKIKENTNKKYVFLIVVYICLIEI